MMVIAIAPAHFHQAPAAPGAGRRAAADSAPSPAAPSAPVAPGGPAARRDSAPAVPRRATALDRAGRQPPPRPRARASCASPRRSTPMASARRAAGWSRPGCTRYRSMAPEDSGRTAEILPPDSRLLGLTLVLGRDTIPLDELVLHAPPPIRSTSPAPTPLRLSRRAGPGRASSSTYTFAPDDYRIEVSGRVTGVGPNGGHAAGRDGARRWPTPRPTSRRTTAPWPW